MPQRAVFRVHTLPFCNACTRRTAFAGDDGKTRYKFSEGAVTIKEVIDKSFWGVFNTAGLLAEFKVVGTWDASPIDALPEKKLSSE